MSAHDLYVLVAYLVAAIVLGAVFGALVLDRRHLLRRHEEMRSAGLRRRSDPS